jgi:hypothetical protein
MEGGHGSVAGIREEGSELQDAMLTGMRAGTELPSAMWGSRPPAPAAVSSPPALFGHYTLPPLSRMRVLDRHARGADPGHLCRAAFEPRAPRQVHRAGEGPLACTRVDGCTGGSFGGADAGVASGGRLHGGLVGWLEGGARWVMCANLLYIIITVSRHGVMGAGHHATAACTGRISLGCQAAGPARRLAGVTVPPTGRPDVAVRPTARSTPSPQVRSALKDGAVLHQPLDLGDQLEAVVKDVGQPGVHLGQGGPGRLPWVRLVGFWLGGEDGGGGKRGSTLPGGGGARSFGGLAQGAALCSATDHAWAPANVIWSEPGLQPERTV